MSSTKTIIPVVLSGGSGIRLWPLSTPERPKQLLPLTAEKTMLQLTVDRTKGFAGAHIERPILIANQAHASIIDEQLTSANVADYLLLLEPFGRNTAPAIGLAALEAKPEDILLVMPSDHVISDIAAFHAAIERALPLVVEGWLVTFGITPESPETGYGYIKMGAACADSVYKVTRFVEKPDASRAAQMLTEGNYVWNAGIFLFRADAYLSALDRHQPEMLVGARAALAGAVRSGSHIFLNEQAFATCPSESVDYAIMEREDRIACVPVNMGWSDVGSWDSLYAISPKDTGGNVVRGEAVTLGAKNCLVHTDALRVTLVEVDDLIVVVSQNEVMIMRRGLSQKIRQVVETINKTENDPEFLQVSEPK